MALLGMMITGCGNEAGSEGGTSAQCEVAASDAQRVCVDAVGDARLGCYLDTNAPCASDDATFAAALTVLKDSVESNCSDDGLHSLSVDALVARLQTSCMSETQSIGSRTFGGPHGVVWAEALADQRTCLRTAHEAVSAVVDGALLGANDCLAADECDASALDAATQTASATAVSEIETACDSTPLDGLIAVSPATYVGRAMQQVDCMVATAHPDTAPLTLSCGPSNVDMDPPRGEYMQVIVDGDKWGTLCGDGTDYAFQIRLAPEGEPLDRLIIGLEGGGVCFFEEDCTARMESNPGLFNAQDNEVTETGVGIMSNDPEENPFANWTKVYLPYCNQDVFAGAGVVEEFGLPRYGAVNARSAIQMVRDLLWKLMDEEGGDGFRPDEIITLFGGWSAGGYGALYNYHWLLDDLQWPRTAAFPDAGGALDNGGALSVRTMGFTLIPSWGALPNLPPYCFSGDCAVGPFIYEKSAPRLKTVPEQQFLILSNQKDLTQQGDAFFMDEDHWINTMRRDYCGTKDLNGIHYYYSSESMESVHVISIRPEFYEGEVAGIELRNWLAGAITDPDGVIDIAEEGTFVDDIPGASPFPCQVAP